MRQTKILVLRDLPVKPRSTDQELIITFDELKQWAVRGTLLKHLFRYREATLVTYRSDVMIKPFLTALLLRLLCHGKCFIQDAKGFRQAVTTAELAKLFISLSRDLMDRRQLFRRIHNELSTCIEKKKMLAPETNAVTGDPVYLRTDLWFGVLSGGSLGHIAGVLNNLEHFSGKPVFLTSDAIPTVRTDIETRYVSPEQRFWDFLELPGLFYNQRFFETAKTVLEGKKISFIYQRYSLNNYAGLKLARSFSVPFVLEYNGSEVWVNRHWGKPLKYESLAERIEVLNLKGADLVVVVSEPLKKELQKRGIDSNKILVNPNGVDPEKYRPDQNGSRIRSELGLSNKTVIGFIGTFGRWHGAEVLAEAAGRLFRSFSQYRDYVHLLMIGDGSTMPAVRERLTEYNVWDHCILTGQVPQEEGPSYLAACDILVAPHVPNPDGTPFFGSPTKLFEYMAMGRGIVASDLDQIGQILKHGETGWLVKPGDPESLMHGLKKLVDDELLRERLGKAARTEVVARYTWKEHTRRIVEKLRDVVNAEAQYNKLIIQ